MLPSAGYIAKECLVQSGTGIQCKCEKSMPLVVDQGGIDYFYFF